MIFAYYNQTAEKVYYKCGNKFIVYHKTNETLSYAEIQDKSSITSDSINDKTIIYGDNINYYGSYDSNNAYDTLTRVDNPYLYNYYLGSNEKNGLVENGTGFDKTGLVAYTPKLFVYTDRADARFFFNDFVYNRPVSIGQSINTNNIAMLGQDA